MSQRLPSKLGKEPLIDAIFEVRFDSLGPAASLMPGLVLPLLDGGATAFEPLPAAQLPPEIRDGDENLKLAPLMRVVWGSQFAVLFGDRTLSIGCKMPYAGWTEFRKSILKVMQALESAAFIKRVYQFSLKYVDFFDKSDLRLSGLQRFNVNLSLGPVQVQDEILNIRCEIPDGEFLHAVTILTNAFVKYPEASQLEGAILEVDTHRIEEHLDRTALLERLPSLIDAMHDSNKKFFFSCLSEQGFLELEPQYD
ncbi:MAG: TIGR04255 family protein [Acidovorax sp.]|uniref:TIGR04255 family protein n=1 Tax=Acidovorax sp. TaxID=1872122 RepID=UPI00262B9BBC|nr:TIGR04255 family protein [Acidovorax sp.]MDH4418905.1 TIGR04255 family protein [Acidovorax sp.]